MRLALREGLRGWGRVAPNPMVGCAIVDRDGRLLSLGHHARVGGAHAEVDALSKIPDATKLEGARVYVTLEPCAHEGRTGSCAKALAKLPIAEVVYAVQDPNPLVAGSGARILRDAGIAARELVDCQDIDERDELIAAAEELAEIFLHNMRVKRPFISLKVATTLDGQMAMATGESKWITGESSRARAHVLRAGHDAVLIGRRTFELDDPRLDVRAPGFEGLPNIAVLLDPSGSSFAKLPGSALVSAREASNVIVVISDVAPEQAEARAADCGVRVVRAPIARDGSFEAQGLLSALWDAGVHSALVEGGARTYATFAQTRDFQRLHAFVAPMIFGGRKGLAWSKDFGFGSLAEGLRLARPRAEILDGDVYITGRV